MLYRHGNAPPLLYQMLFYGVERPEEARGSNVIRPIALLVDHGHLTVSVYGGFSS